MSGATACDDKTAIRDEAASLSRAVDELREAPNADKASKLKALRALGCNHADTCGFRDQCADAYGEHVKGLEGIAKAKAMDDPFMSASELKKAEEALKAAEEKTAACADRQGALVRQYRLRDLR
ncbi:MAG: hypothetical protein H6718_26915 [Polyangiaceae bacterium]|nr:hypothetical protein [Polyangiaceae bacterium]